ncbi:MAG: GTPase HflX, partial [Candidatus Zixiibacteriota bacterium]
MTRSAKIPNGLIREKTYIAYMQPEERNIAETAYLVALARLSYQRKEAEDSLDELAELTISAGGKVAGKVVQVRPPDPKFYIGKGMVEQLKEMISAKGANLVIFDDPLSPAQQRNLEEALETKVIDRSILILDIFALNARTAAAKLQVELAQLEYMLPRLTGAWSHFSRQYGGVGIGSKGPGETQLEIDRRHVRTRLARLKKELVKLGQQREIQRKGRSNLFKVSLIGYTNAGKSTLFNKLTKADVSTANALFTTLDSTTREVSFGYPQKILFSDTVGFIKKLPHQLVESFKSTLEEVTLADLLLHLVDFSDPNFAKKKHQTENVLNDIKAQNVPKIMIYNKIDRLKEGHEGYNSENDGFYISALNNFGLDELKN